MASTLTREQLAYTMQFQHPEKSLADMPGPPDDEFLAALFAVDIATYRAIRDQFAAHVHQAAQDLLADSAFAAAVDRLPFAPRSTVVGLGDSITDDYQSWLEILRHLLAIRRPHDEIALVNAGISGDTTSQAISRFLDVVLARPDWIICMLGTNDARRHGVPPSDTIVSPADTARNYSTLREFAARQTMARWVWITPATVIEEMIDAHWHLGRTGHQITFRNDDLTAVADVVRSRPEPVVDLQPVFGIPARADLLLPDGLHPSLAGQIAIVRALVERLALL